MNKLSILKYIKLLFALGLVVSAIIVSTSCSNEAEEGSSMPIGHSMLDLGYENCLVCHVGGLNPMAVHCNETMKEEASLDMCLVCHIDMRSIIAGDDPLINCTDCHYPYTDE
mgnify:CR=1 FL=1|jgi:hypothetical protein